MQSYKEKYHNERRWSNKVIILELFHLIKKNQDRTWNITKTATIMEISIGAVSENLRIAEYAHLHPEILECASRQDALRMLNGFEKRDIQNNQIQYGPQTGESGQGDGRDNDSGS